MSRAAKATFALTTLGSVGIMVFVHELQAGEREALHQGPIRDQERQRLKREAERAAAATASHYPVEMTQVQKQRAAEYELQKELREQYAKAQTVSEGPSNTDK